MELKEELRNIIKGILQEEATIPSVRDAIRRRKEVKINYQADNDPKGSGERLIQPVAYGLSKAGNLVVRAFQPYGDTKTRVPHWKLFRLDKITSWKTLWKNTFSEPPSEQFNADGKYNPKGDNTMSVVYLNADFEGSKGYYNGTRAKGLRDYNQRRQQQAQERDPLYKFKQNLAKAGRDVDVERRIKQYPSNAAKSYVNGNDDYVKDLERVNLDNREEQNQPQTTGPIEKDNIKYQNSQSNERNSYDEIEQNGPITKTDNNNEEK